MVAAAQLALFEAPARTVSPALAAIESPSTHSLPPRASSRKRSQAWLALHLASLSLAAAYRAASADRRAVLDNSPWAVINDDRLKHVVACDRHAWERGVRPGHRMNAAIALCGSLELVSRNLATEAQLIEHIATACLNYTSAVSIQPPNEILLEVRGSLRLFGGPTALLERVQTDLAPLGAGLQMALAPTARGAQWIARASIEPSIFLPRQLAPGLNSLPIAALQWPLTIELQLARFGVTCVGDLMRLSRKDLARRIGLAPVRELQQALGRTPWLHHGWALPPSYHDRVLFDFEVETTGLLERLLERPFARLKRALIGASRQIDELAITLKHREGATPLTLRLQHTTADTAHLAKLLHEHLDRLVLRAPVREVTFDVPRLLVARPHNQSLAVEPSSRGSEEGIAELKARLLEQLQSRFGVQMIRALALHAHHVPERAQRPGAPSQSATSIHIPPRLPRRPLWFLREPTLATAQYRRGELRIESSPETIESEGWDSPRVRRAYYRARTSDGVQCWIFRDLAAPHDWYVHGLFG